MALKAIYDKKEDIPETYADLYTERDGKWELTGIEGVKTQADVDRLQESLRKATADKKVATDKLKLFGEDTPETVEELKQKNEELQIKVDAGAGGTIDETKLEELAERKAKTLLAPVERENARLTTANAELTTSNETLNVTIDTAAIHGDLRMASTEAKVVTSAIEDILTIGERIFERVDGKTVTRDGVGVTPGVEPSVWMTEMKDKRGHWWATSQGGDAQGGKGGKGNFPDNPWSREHWNMTQQSLVVTQKGQDIANQMAKAAGSTVGAAHPAPAPTA